VSVPSTATLIDALVMRARRGRAAAGTQVLSEELASVRTLPAYSRNPSRAVDELLSTAISGVSTPYLMGGRGSHPHSQEEIHLCLTVYARLSVAERLTQRAAAESAVPVREPGHVSDPSQPYSERRDRLLSFDPDRATWAQLEKAMADALGIAQGTVANKWVPLAPTLLAAELLRREAEVRSPNDGSVAHEIMTRETALLICGLGPYLESQRVAKSARALQDMLDAPVRDYADFGHYLGSVIRLLDSTYHSLRGISVAEDAFAASNDEYFEKQLSVLAGRGIDIERVFIYADDDADAIVAVAEEQQRRANEVIRAACANRAGSYSPYLVPRHYADTILPDETYASLAIFDAGAVTARVARRLMPPHRGRAADYTVTARAEHVDDAMEIFHGLKDHVDWPRAS
jgi:hypothetical protein